MIRCQPGVTSVVLLAAGLAAPLGIAAATHGGRITGEVNATPAKYRGGVVVYLDKVEGNFPAPKSPEMDQKALKFAPKVLAITKGTAVRFVNSDTVAHNVFSPDGEKYDLGSWPKGESKTYTFAKTGVYTQLCRIHPEMIGYIVVVDNPFFAVTSDDGKFQIDGVPPGTYTLKAWSERLPEASQSVTVTAGGNAEIKVELKR